MTTTAIVSVDELCVALETVLATHLPAQMDALGFTVAAGYKRIRDWQQLPTVPALTAAKLPAGAITSAGLASTPKWVPSRRAYETTWRLAVGVYVRGSDHDTTQAHARDYAAAIRVCVLRNKGLDGLAAGLRWRGEDYALRPERSAARTLAVAAVAFDVDALTLATGKPIPDQPLVTETPTTLSVQ